MMIFCRRRRLANELSCYQSYRRTEQIFKQNGEGQLMCLVNDFCLSLLRIYYWF